MAHAVFGLWLLNRHKTMFDDPHTVRGNVSTSTESGSMTNVHCD